MFGVVSPRYKPLDTATVIDYVRGRSELNEIFQPSEPLESVEVGDGNLNLVFKVWATADANRTVVVKQALPYVRLVGESWPLPPDRARIEAQALEIEYRLVPQHTPRVYFFDPDMYLTAMQNLNNHIIMRKGLMQGIEYPHFADHIGVFLARTLGATSDLVLDYQTKKLEVMRFINPELCKITEDLIFIEPYRPTERNIFHPELAANVQAIYDDEALRAEAALLREKFMTQAQALVHGDLHTGSIMINAEETYVIDPEFAFYGPMGFDIGAVVGNLLLSYASHEVRSKDPTKRQSFRQYLTATIHRLWAVFEREFQASVWDTVDPVNFPKAYQQGYMLRLLQDTAGFGAAKMLRRIIGLAGVADIRASEDVTDKSIAASLALNIGVALMKRRGEIQTIGDLLAIAREQKPNYPYRD